MSIDYAGPTPIDRPHLPEALQAQHYAMLAQESGISDAVITARGYRTSTGYSELKSLGIALPSRADAHGLLLPVHTVEGKPATWFDVKANRPVPLVQYRLVQPWVDDEGRERKYLYPKGVGMSLDCAPVCQKHLDDPTWPLWITEGLKKEDALVSHGLVALGLFGVWNFRGTNAKGGKVILPDWQYVHLENREARVVFDSDVQEKAGVFAALETIVSFLTFKRARVHVAYLPSQDGKKVGVDDYLLEHSPTALEGLLVAPGRRTALPRTVSLNGATPTPTLLEAWQETLSRTKGGELKETFANLVLTLQHLPPWDTQCWHDVVRELPMCGAEVLSDAMVGHAALALERQGGIPIRNLKLVQSALVSVCRQKPRDVLQEWLAALPPWDETPRLTQWLCAHAGALSTAYVQEVSRLLPVSMVARALDPGCQYRSVIVLEGAENIGKSKLVEALVGPDWYREVSHGMEGKEAHMILQGAWVAEFAELSSYNKTEGARFKSFITMKRDDYIPKFANAPVSRLRRTVFVGTHNPEGDGRWMREQTGNTRFLPIAVKEINIDAVVAIREQLFAEALVYYREHPTDWWQLTGDSEREAGQEREARRRPSVYEASLAVWLTEKTETTWEEIAQHYLHLEAKEKWKDTSLQMQIAIALRGLGWQSKQQWRDGRNIRLWLRS